MKRSRVVVAAIAAAGSAAAVLALGISPAAAATPPGNQYFLTNGTTGGAADIAFAYGRADDVVHVGDWNGDGTDTLGVRRGNQYYLTNSTTGGSADLSFAYGKAGDVVLVGDWNGDGTDTLGVRRGNQYFLTNGTKGGTADITFAYGKAGDVVLVGDWNGDGTDTLGVRRGSQYFLTNGTTGGAADITFAYGKAADVVLIGDWNGDGTNTLGVRRASQYFLTNGTTGGSADISFAYGKADDVVLVGDWNGDGTDTLGIRRPAVVRATIPAASAGQEWSVFNVPGTVKPTLYKSTNATADCVWVTADAADQEIGYGFGYGAGHSAYVQIGSDARYFYEKPMCGTWTEALPYDTKTLATSVGNGQYRVGIDMATGIYQTTVPAGSGIDGCYVSSIADFRGVDATSILDNYRGSAGETLRWAVLPEEAGFETDGCGTWTKVGELDELADAPAARSSSPAVPNVRGTTPVQPRHSADMEPFIG